MKQSGAFFVDRSVDYTYDYTYAQLYRQISRIAIQLITCVFSALAAR